VYQLADSEQTAKLDKFQLRSFVDDNQQVTRAAGLRPELTRACCRRERVSTRELEALAFKPPAPDARERERERERERGELAHTLQRYEIGMVGFGAARQKLALERWTNPKRLRRTCTCESGLQACRGKSAGVAKRPRVSSSAPRNPFYDSHTFPSLCHPTPPSPTGEVVPGARLPLRGGVRRHHRRVRRPLGHRVHVRVQLLLELQPRGAPARRLRHRVQVRAPPTERERERGVRVRGGAGEGGRAVRAAAEGHVRKTAAGGARLPRAPAFSDAEFGESQR
jgi:hypothetical protein